MSLSRRRPNLHQRNSSELQRTMQWLRGRRRQTSDDDIALGLAGDDVEDLDAQIFKNLWKHHRLGDVKVGGVLLAACSRALSRHWLAGRVPQVYSVQHAH